MATARLDELTVRTCRELLATGVVGRVALCTSNGPQILPVSYVVDGASLVFRTSPYGVLGRHAASSRIAFEVDDLERTTRSGWSVVASGRGERVQDADALALLRAFRDPNPWAPGVRFLYVRLVWDTLTGRRVSGGAPQSRAQS